MFVKCCWFFVEYGFDVVCRFVRVTNVIRRCCIGGVSDEGEWSCFEDNVKVWLWVVILFVVN